MKSVPAHNNDCVRSVVSYEFSFFLVKGRRRRRKYLPATAESETSVRFCGGGSPKWRVVVYMPPYFLLRSFLLLIIQLLLELSCCIVPQSLSLRHLNYQLSSARPLAKPPPVPPSIREFMVLGLLILPTFERFISLLSFSFTFFLIFVSCPFGICVCVVCCKF